MVRILAAICFTLSMFQTPVASAQFRPEPELWGPLWESEWDELQLQMARPWSLDLSLGRRTLVSLREDQDGWFHSDDAEYYAVARLHLPLLSLFTPASESSSVDSPHGSLPQGSLPQDTPPESKAESEEGPLPEAESVPTPAPPAEKETEQGFLRLVRTVHDKVIEEHGGAPARIRLASLIRRSRQSGWVPELRLRGVYGFDRTTSLEEAVGIYPGETTVRGARDSLIEGRLTFRLDRLVFGNGEAGLERQRLELEKEGQKKAEEATELLLRWKTAETLSQDQSLHPDEQFAAKVKAEASLAHLHLLTNGWFRGRPTLRELELEHLVEVPAEEKPRPVLKEPSPVPAAVDVQ